MPTQKLQIIGSSIKQAENADTLDGKHASDFASASDIETVKIDSSTKDAVVLVEAQLYTDNAVAQKSQVQIITWEEND